MEGLNVWIKLLQRHKAAGGLKRLCVSYIHERRVDVIGALPVDGDQEGEAPVGRQDVHAAVLLVVPGQQSNAAVLYPQRGSHHVQGLQAEKHNERWSHADAVVPRALQLIICQCGD